MSLCFSLKIIFQTQNHRNTPKWWTVCPETSVELCFQKSSFYFIGNVGICITCCFACWLPNWEQFYAVIAYLTPVPLPPDALYRDILLQKPEGRTTEAVSCVDLLRWGGSFSREFIEFNRRQRSLGSSQDFHMTWEFHVLYVLVSWLSAIGILCSPVTALCSAGSWWNSPLPNLPRAHFSMSAQVIEEKMIIRLVHFTMTRAK